MSRTIRKTKRKGLVADGKVPYVASSCRHHGSCPYCESNRTFERVEELPDNLLQWAHEEDMEALCILDDFDSHPDDCLSGFDDKPWRHAASYRKYLDGFNEVVERAKRTKASDVKPIPSGMSQEKLREFLIAVRDHVRKEQGLEEYED